MNTMNDGQLYDVVYTDNKGQKTERVIIVMDQPKHYRVLDVTDGSVEHVNALQDAVLEYHEYRRLLENQILPFERWMGQVNKVLPVGTPVKHRRLVADRVQIR